MERASKETNDTPSTSSRQNVRPNDIIDPHHDQRVDLPIDDRPGGERDLNPRELMNVNEDIRNLIDREDYDSEQAYQIALASSKDIDKTERNPRPLNFDGES